MMGVCLRMHVHLCVSIVGYPEFLKHKFLKFGMTHVLTFQEISYCIITEQPVEKVRCEDRSFVVFLVFFGYTLPLVRDLSRPMLSFVFLHTSSLWRERFS